MKKTLFTLIISSFLSFGSLCVNAAEANAQALVIKIKGSVTSLSSGQVQPATLKVGDKLSQGATIVTSPDSEVDIQAFNGAVASIKANSTVNLEKLSVITSGGSVTKQTALLNLKVGDVLSTIDPANHNINDYGIRTPKGVAAARGTVFGVSVSKSGNVKVYVTTSTVVFTNPVTNQSVTVAAGYQISVDEDGIISTPVLAPSTPTDGSVEVGDKNAGTPKYDSSQNNSSSLNASGML